MASSCVRLFGVEIATTAFRARAGFTLNLFRRLNYLMVGKVIDRANGKLDVNRCWNADDNDDDDDDRHNFPTYRLYSSLIESIWPVCMHGIGSDGFYRRDSVPSGHRSPCTYKCDSDGCFA